MKIFVKDNPINDFVEMYVVDDSSHVRKNIYYNGDGLFTVETIVEGEYQELKPFLKCPSGMFREIVSEIVEYANKNHIQSQDKDFTRGKLEATEKHLEDMRKYLDKAMKL